MKQQQFSFNTSRTPFSAPKYSLGKNTPSNTWKTPPTLYFRTQTTRNIYFKRNFSIQKTSSSIPAEILRLNNGLMESEITQEKMLENVDSFQVLPESFAVILVGGNQFKVTKGDEIMVNIIEAPVQSKILLDKVLLIGTKEHTVIGTPLLTKAKVYASVEEHSKTEKLIVYKRRGDTKSSRTRSGHRQPYTLLHILDIMVHKE